MKGSDLPPKSGQRSPYLSRGTAQARERGYAKNNTTPNTVTTETTQKVLETKKGKEAENAKS